MAPEFVQVSYDDSSGASIFDAVYDLVYTYTCHWYFDLNAAFLVPIVCDGEGFWTKEVTT